MSTDDLRDRLVADLRPTPPLFVARRLLMGAGAGTLISIALVGLILGYRVDMATAVTTPMFWWKLGYLLALATSAFFSADRFARPDSAGGWGYGAWALAALSLAVVIAGWQLIAAPATERHTMIMGQSARVCPWGILASSIAPMVGLMWAARGLGPTRPVAAGAAIGLFAGGLGAAAYALHCPEPAAPFLAIWYTLGVAGAALTGAIVGPLALRWSPPRLDRPSSPTARTR